MNASLPVSLAPAFAPAYPLNFSTAVSEAEKLEIAAISVHSSFDPSATTEYISRLKVGHVPTMRELLDLCTALHAVQVDTSDLDLSCAFLYQKKSFEDMGDVLFEAAQAAGVEL